MGFKTYAQTNDVAVRGLAQLIDGFGHDHGAKMSGEVKWVPAQAAATARSAGREAFCRCRAVRLSVLVCEGCCQSPLHPPMTGIQSSQPLSTAAGGCGTRPSSRAPTT
jgi:hypothetical protein